MWTLFLCLRWSIKWINNFKYDNITIVAGRIAEASVVSKDNSSEECARTENRTGTQQTLKGNKSTLAIIHNNL